MWRKVLALALVGLAYQHWSAGGYIGLEAGPAAPGDFHDALPSLQQDPLQRPLETRPAALQFGDYRLLPLATVGMTARVLGAERYRSGREADLSPVDLALGWGPMSDQDVLDDITVRQSGRFYFWSARQLPIPRRSIETHSANMHMIPASRELERNLRALRPGDIVRLQGYLVEVRATDGWRWRSSLTREDTGAGACELVLLQALDRASR